MESKYSLEERVDGWYVSSPLVSMGPYETYDVAYSVLLSAKEEEQSPGYKGRIPTLEELGVKLEVDDFIPQTVKSDGGSSTYYSFEMMAHKDLVPLRVEVELEDIIKEGFDNDFDLGNVVKAARRISESYQGRGKQGINALYDWNKILYTAQKNIDWIEGRDV